MKRILCLIDCLGSGGAQRQITELAKLLHATEYFVTVVTWIHKPHDHFFEDEIIGKGIDFQCHPQLRKKLTRVFELRKLVKQHKPDIIISYYEGVSAELCIDHLFRRKAYKLLVSERSITMKLDFPRWIRFQTYRFADYIVPNSSTESDFIRNRFPFLAHKVHTICNCVDETRFYPCQKEISDFNEVNAIFVGRYHKLKNIPSLMRALATVKNSGRKFHVDFYGRDIEEHCSDLVNELGISDCVTFCEQSGNIENMYRKHNLFILSSLYEGFPNVLCEAMCCGLPVLCSRVSDVPRIMKDGCNGYTFSPTDIDDMAEKIIKYLDHSAKKKFEMGKMSIELSKSKFTRDLFIDKYQSLLN